jgi:hypothetical protein|tara:strand:+ start:321 stop:1361 length:1041 start_codon:yes stop_codon:yes gene_type:complete
MDSSEKSFIVEKLLSGVIFFRFDGQIYKIVSPTPEKRTLAEFLAKEAGEGLNYNQLITKEQLKQVLHNRGIWTSDDDKRLKAAEETVEEIQISIFKNFYNTKAKQSLKRRLAGVRKAITDAIHKKSSTDHVTLESYKDFVRDRFAIALSIFDLKENQIYDPDKLLDQSSGLLDFAYDRWIEEYSIVPYLREVSRTNPWKSYWDSQKDNPIFDFPSSHFNIFQRNLILYSKMYDNARQSPEAPPDEVFNDDDAFDGWSTIQRKEADKYRDQKNADKISGQKGGEIFMVTNREDAENIYDLNTHSDRMKVKNRLKEVKQAGGEVIHEHQLSDVKMRLRKELMEMATKK